MRYFSSYLSRLTPVLFGSLSSGILLFSSPVCSKPIEAQTLDIPPEILNNSPTLQRWLNEIPDVLEEIKTDPSFRTRVRLGYTQFPSSGDAGGVTIGIKDIFLGKTPLTLSGDYQTSFDERNAGGADLRYYVLPLGSYVNLAPVVGYRYLGTQNYATDGLNLGVTLLLALSRDGAADITLTQSFIAPGSADEAGISTLSVGYAVTENLRLSTDIQKENSRAKKDSSVSILFEWMP